VHLRRPSDDTTLSRGQPKLAQGRGHATRRIALLFSLPFFGAGLVRAQDVNLSPGIPRQPDFWVARYRMMQTAAMLGLPKIGRHRGQSRTWWR
jgi:hypothetical protein